MTDKKKKPMATRRNAEAIYYEMRVSYEDPKGLPLVQTWLVPGTTALGAITMLKNHLLTTGATKDLSTFDVIDLNSQAQMDEPVQLITSVDGTAEAKPHGET